MASLKSIAELTWNQLFPRGGDEAKIRKEEVLATAKTEYAYQVWVKMKAEKAEDEWEVPSWMLSEAELQVEDDVMDISSLKIMRGLDSEEWLQNVGGINCECRYVKTTVNRAQLLCDDDSLPEDARTYYVIEKKIKFPRGVHTTPLPIIYANNGEKANETIEIDDTLGGMVRRGLLEIYLQKIGKENKTTDGASDT